MIEKQELKTVEVGALVGAVSEMKNKGYRLVQISPTTLGGFELNYSFDKDYSFTNIRVMVASDEVVVPSVSSIYPNAFLYENEIHDLFGIKISGISIDYKGNFYQTTIKHPFGSTKPPVNPNAAGAEA
jgi:ech hydrogenase subunit D